MNEVVINSVAKAPNHDRCDEHRHAEVKVAVKKTHAGRAFVRR
jgi:hypothetical protein